MQRQARGAVDVRVHDERPALDVRVDLEVPFVLEHVRPAVAREVVPRDPGDVPPRVRREGERAGVAGPGGGAEARVVLLRRDVHGLAARQVDEMEVVVARALRQSKDAEQIPVRREPRHLAVAARREDAALLARRQRVDEDVEVLPVAPVAGVREQRPVGRQPRRQVEEVGLDDEGLVRRPGLGIGEVELRALVAAGVDREEQAPAARDEAAVDGLVQLRQLSRHVRAGRGEVELEAPGHVPAHEHRAVPADVGRDRRADRQQGLERRQRGSVATPAGRRRSASSSVRRRRPRPRPSRARPTRCRRAHRPGRRRGRRRPRRRPRAPACRRP